MLDVAIAAPQRREALTVFPLVTRDEAELPYRLLPDALETGAVRITEVGSGTVPELLATNRGDADVLILDGEQLIGARQNRMTNRTILLPARSETKIPVSCMERGRWRFVGDAFAPSAQHSPSQVRRQARRAEAGYAAVGMAAPPEALSMAQGAVWGEIAAYARALGVRSETEALDDLYRPLAADLDRATAALPHVDGQVGLLAFVGDRPVGLDVIGGRALYARLHGRLVRGYLMDALGAAPAAGRGAGRAAGAGGRPGSEAAPAAGGPASRPAGVTAAAAHDYLDLVRPAQRVETPTVGRGTYRVLAGAVIGGELVDAGRLVHLSAFPADGKV